MIPHIHTLFEFISIPYENQHQTLNIKKIDRGQIKFREYSITLLQPKFKIPSKSKNLTRSINYNNPNKTYKAQRTTFSSLNFITVTYQGKQSSSQGMRAEGSPRGQHPAYIKKKQKSKIEVPRDVRNSKGP